MRVKTVIKRIIIGIGIFLVAMWVFGFILLKTGYQPPAKPEQSQPLTEAPDEQTDDAAGQSTTEVSAQQSDEMFEPQTSQFAADESSQQQSKTKQQDFLEIEPVHFIENKKESVWWDLEATILTQHNRRDTSGKEGWELKKNDPVYKHIMIFLKGFKYKAGDKYAGKYIINNKMVDVNAYIIANGILGNKIRIICRADKID
jgi:hypothetical protein